MSIIAETTSSHTPVETTPGQCPVENMNVGDVWRLAKAMGVPTASIVEASRSVTNGSTPAEVIPALTADNFQEVTDRYRERFAGAAFRGEGMNRLRNPALVTADGKDTVWLVAQEEDRLWLDSKLPCSIPNCSGHDTNEVKSWDALSHEVMSVNLPTLDLGNMHINDGEVTLHLRSNRQVINFYSHVEGELSARQAENLVRQLKATITSLESFMEAARTLETN